MSASRRPAIRCRRCSERANRPVTNVPDSPQKRLGATRPTSTAWSDSAAGEKAQASTPEPSTEAEDPRPRVTWGAGSTPKSKKEPIPKWIWAAIGVTLLLVASFGVYAAERSKNQQDAAAVVTTTTTLSPEVERRRCIWAPQERLSTVGLRSDPE